MLPIGWALRICAYTCYSITNNTNIAAVVVVVRRVAHHQRVVGNARASGGAAARRRPPPPPPRSTLSFAPPGRHRSPWTSSGARPARKNCWSSIRLDVSTPAFCVVLARGKVRSARSWWPAMYCRPSPWPCQIVALAQITTRWR